MKFIAIDSSMSNTGIAVGYITENKGVVVEYISLHETKKTTNKQVRASSDTVARGRSTHKFIHNLITDEQPLFVFAETPTGSQSANGMKSYGMTCQLIASISPAPIELTPTEVKVASHGSKTASKRDMIDWAYDLYPELTGWAFDKRTGKVANKSEHMADAIAIAHAGVKSDEFDRLFNLFKQRN